MCCSFFETNKCETNNFRNRSFSWLTSPGQTNNNYLDELLIGKLNNYQHYVLLKKRSFQTCLVYLLGNESPTNHFYNCRGKEQHNVLRSSMEEDKMDVDISFQTIHSCKHKKRADCMFHHASIFASTSLKKEQLQSAAQPGGLNGLIDFLTLLSHITCKF